MNEVKMNVVRFDESDVIATSTVAFIGFGDGDNTNNVIAGFTLDPNASGNRFNNKC